MPWLNMEDAALTYTGAWKTRLFETASLGSMRESDEAEASWKWRGVCAAAIVHAAAGGDCGIGEVWVDGAKHGDFDLYAPEPGAATYRIDGLAPGPHTIEMRRSGRKREESSGYGVNVDHALVDFAPAALRGVRRILCIGDSITFGANVTPRPEGVYGRRLQRMLSVPVEVHGMTGASIRKIAGVLDAVVAPRRPDLVLWVAGMNDAHPREPLEDAIDAMRLLLPGVAIVVSTIPYNTYYADGQNRTKAEEVRTACRNKRIPLVDLYAATAGNDAIHRPEGTVHPNAEAHQLIADLFYNELIARFS